MRLHALQSLGQYMQGACRNSRIAYHPIIPDDSRDLEIRKVLNTTNI